MNSAPSSPRRVLYLVSLFPCWSETFIVREITRLVARGVDVRILSLKPPHEALVQRDASALQSRVLPPPIGLRASALALREVLRSPIACAVILAATVAAFARRPAVLAKSLVALWRGLGALPDVRRFDPEWLHAHWATYPSTVAWALARLLGRPFSFTAHAHDIFVEDHLLARKIVDAARIVTISRHNVAHLSRWGLVADDPRLEIVHCGVDPEQFAVRLDGRDDDRIVAIGRLDPIKGFDILLPALAALRAQGVRFRCTVIGEGERRRDLERQRDALGLADVVDFPGARPQEQVREALASATVVAMPSVRTPEGNMDGIPVALMEAMATGAAVVATRVSGLPELVAHEVSGLLVPERDVPALAHAIGRLLADPALRRRLGAAAREVVVADFDARREADRLLAAFHAPVPAAGEVAHAR